MRPWTGIKQQSCRHLADVCRLEMQVKRGGCRLQEETGRVLTMLSHPAIVGQKIRSAHVHDVHRTPQRVSVEASEQCSGGGRLGDVACCAGPYIPAVPSR